MSDFAQTVSCDRLPQRMRREDGAVLLHLLDERVERRREPLLDVRCLSRGPTAAIITPTWPSRRGDLDQLLPRLRIAECRTRPARAAITRRRGRILVLRQVVVRPSRAAQYSGRSSAQVLTTQVRVSVRAAGPAVRSACKALSASGSPHHRPGSQWCKVSRLISTSVTRSRSLRQDPSTGETSSEPSASYLDHFPELRRAAARPEGRRLLESAYPACRSNVGGEGAVLETPVTRRSHRTAYPNVLSG